MAELILADNELMLAFETYNPTDVKHIPLQIAFISSQPSELIMTLTANPVMRKNRLVFHLPGDPEGCLLKVFQYSNNLRAGILSTGILTCVENLKVDESIVYSSLDPLLLNIQRLPSLCKPGKVAVFTHAYNEGAMLSFWERHFAGLVGYENCFVIDNGGDDGSVDDLNRMTNKIRLPLSPIDHWEWCQFNGYFLRFLLRKYKWAIHVDTDEMLVCDGDFQQRLLNTPVGIYAPEKAIAVVHDISHEATFNFSRPLVEQRSNFVYEIDGFKKPCIASIPVTWQPGFHRSYEPWSELSGIWLVHMREVDSVSVARRNVKFAKRSQTARDAQIYAGVKCWQNKSDEQIDKEGVEYIKQKFSEPRITLPEWFYSAI
jgi:Glycosyl transferase family 2